MHGKYLLCLLRFTVSRVLSFFDSHVQDIATSLPHVFMLFALRGVHEWYAINFMGPVLRERRKTLWRSNIAMDIPLTWWFPATSHGVILQPANFHPYNLVISSQPTTTVTLVGSVTTVPSRQPNTETAAIFVAPAICSCWTPTFRSENDKMGQQPVAKTSI